MITELKSNLKTIYEELNEKLTPENIKEGVSVFGIEGNLKEGTDTSDATALAEDIIAPKTAYINGKKVEGLIIPTYSESGTMTNSQKAIIAGACDVREDLGFYLKIESNQVRVYSLEDGTLEQSINSLSEISSASGVSRTIFDAKFSKSPITTAGSIYNIVMLAAGLSGSTVSDGLAVSRFDTKNPTVVGEYFMCNGTSGGDNGGRYGSYGFTIVENDGYVYSTLLTYSNYYKSWNGKNKFYYINNENKTITKLAELSGIGAAGLVPYMTDDHRMILINCPNHLQLARVNDGNTPISSITSYAPSATNPRIILTNDGYFYYDKGYYNTNKELLHQYESLPWGYNDVVLWCNGYLVRFNTTSTVTVYSFNKDTFEIAVAKTFEVNGKPNCNYYSTGVSNHYSMSVNNHPEANAKTIAFSTANGSYYTIYLDVENLNLEMLDIKGVSYRDTSSVDTTSDKLLTGNVMFTREGKVRGTMKNNGSLAFIPATTSQSIPSGYTAGGTIEGDSNLIAGNIRADKTIFGIAGTAPITFATTEELEANTNFPENTLAIVYGTSYIGTYKLDSGVWTQIGDTTEEVQIFNTLNEIANTTEEFEGTGGTDEEINTILDEIIGTI